MCPLANCKRKTENITKRKDTCPCPPQPGLTSLAKAPFFDQDVCNAPAEGVVQLGFCTIFSSTWLQALCKSGLPTYSSVFYPLPHNMLYQLESFFSTARNRRPDEQIGFHFSRIVDPRVGCEGSVRWSTGVSRNHTLCLLTQP